MEPPTSHVTNAFSDSDSASVEEGGADADADVEALRRLSDNLAAAFRSPEDFAFLAGKDSLHMLVSLNCMGLCSISSSTVMSFLPDYVMLIGFYL